MSKPNAVLVFTLFINFILCKKLSPLPKYMYSETKNFAPVTLNVITGPYLPFGNVISITAAF